MQVRLLRASRELDTLLPEWSRLFAQDPHANARAAPHLILGFHRIFTPQVRPRVLIATDANGVLRGVLPLGLLAVRVGPIIIRRLVPLIDWHAYYFDATVHPDKSDITCRALADALETTGWDRLEVRHLRAESWLLRSGGILERLPGMTRADGLPAPRVSLPRAVALQGRSADDMHRRERALHRTGAVTMGWEVPGPAFRAAVDAFIAMHTALKEFQQQTATFKYGSGARDFPEWLEGEVIAERARLFTIRRDGSLLAAAVVLCGNGEAHSYRAAWAPGGAEFGLGILQTSRVLEACSVAGERVFDLGPGVEAYKAKWRPHVETLVDVAATGVTGRVAFARTWLRLRGRPSPW